MTQVTLSANIGELNSSPVQLIAPPASGVSILIHSAMVVNSTPTSGTPSQGVRLQIFRNTSASYDANAVTHTVNKSATTSAKGSSHQFVGVDTEFFYGEGAYLGASANASGVGWDNDINILLFYATRITV
jgi:hypothetical protein